MLLREVEVLQNTNHMNPTYHAPPSGTHTHTHARTHTLSYTLSLSLARARTHARTLKNTDSAVGLKMDEARSKTVRVVEGQKASKVRIV
jgi:hypothetical protein